MISTQCLHKLPEKKIMHKNVSKYQGFQNRERERERERERQRETERERARERPCFLVTFNIIISHVFPENFIEIPQVFQKI